MAQPGKQELSSDMFKATQDIAAQAAMRAQERLQKVREPPPPPPSGDVPAIPARSSGVFQKAPDIPPKKFAASNAVPPPLPQKPQSVRNNANNNNNNHLENNNGLYAQTQAPQTVFPDVPKRQDFLPQVPSRPDNNNGKPTGGMQLPVKNGQLDIKFNSKPVASKLNQLSPTEDTSSVDALRGIESGLRNMERAMQEQLSLRSMEATEAPKFNVSEFRAGLRNIGSLSSFEQLQPPQYMINNNASNNNNNAPVRPLGLERGMSMDQMRMDNQMRSLESNPNLRTAAEEMKMKPPDALGGGGGGGKARPIEQHMRSLDRSLPLELQYSRNHRQQQLQQQQLLLQQQLVSKVMNAPDPNRHMDLLKEFMLQRTGNAAAGQINPGMVATAGVAGGQVPPNLIGRDDLKMRRRSSHDENQILHNVPSAPGTDLNHLVYVGLRIWDY